MNPGFQGCLFTHPCFVQGIVAWAFLYVSGVVSHRSLSLPGDSWDLESHPTLDPTGQIRLSAGSFEVEAEEEIFNEVEEE